MNRVKTVEVTKAYAAAFNQQNLLALEQFLDGEKTIFVRQTQPTIIGAKAILHRTKKTLKRLKRHGQNLTLVTGIVDIQGVKAHPCLIGILDGERFSVVVLTCKANGVIESISIVLSPDMVGSARPTEAIEQEKIVSAQKNKASSAFTKAALMERKKGLRAKARKLKLRLAKEGRTEELKDKIARFKQAQAKFKEDLTLYKKQRHP